MAILQTISGNQNATMINFDRMKNLLLLSIPLLFLSCTKQPVACLDVSPSKTVKVFDEVQFTSCSEEGHYYLWEIDELQNGVSFTQYSSGEEVNFIWDNPGTYDVLLRVLSENQEKEDQVSEQVTVEDVCYECVSDFNTSDVCYGTYEDQETFDSALQNFEESGFDCSLK